MAALAEMAIFVPAIAPLVAKCYGETPAGVLLWVDLGACQTIACSSGVKQGDATMQQATFCLLLRPEFGDFPLGVRGCRS